MNKVYVETKNVRFPVAEDLYGLFFEDINRADFELTADAEDFDSCGERGKGN